MRLKTCAAVLLFFGSSLAASSAALAQPTVLVTANAETENSVNAIGAGAGAAGLVVASGAVNSSTYEHSQVWEAVRRLQAECSAAAFVTNPQTPHTLTVHVEYEKVNAGIFVGNVALYQLVLLDGGGNPLYVSKKDWLRREIKPVCKAIKMQN